MRIRILMTIVLVLSQIALRAQMDCEVLSNSSMSSSCPNCFDFNKYSSYQYNVNNTPIKNIRIIIHIFNKSDGSGNLPNTTVSREWINSVVFQMNSIWSNVQPMNVPGTNPSNHYSDSRVRLILDNVYFWNDDNAYGSGLKKEIINGVTSYSRDGLHASTIYNQFVNNQSIVTNKSTALHIFLTGHPIGNRGYVDDLGYNYLLATGLPQNYAIDNRSQLANIINHEIGHCLGLDHPHAPWGDGCDDTPPNANCWNGPTCSTNMMDYNAQQWSLTQCQLNKIHYNLMANTAISNALISSISTDNSIIVGNDIICSTQKPFTIPNLQFGVTVSWSASPSTNVVMPNPCGAPILVSTNTSAISSTTLSATLCYGKYGSLSTPTKLLAINTLTGANTLICGNGTGVITGGNIQSSPYPPCTTPFYTTTGQKTKLVANSFIELNQFEFGQGSDVELVISSCP
jgi:hypothetical protein